MKTYLCLESDVRMHQEGGVCKVIHRGKGVFISSSGSWVYLLLRLLWRPIAKDDIEVLLNEEHLQEARTLLVLLEERGIINRFSAENENAALFYFQNKRPFKGKFSCLDRKCIPTLHLEPPTVEAISLSTALGNRYSCSETTSGELSTRNLSTLLALTYGFFPSESGILRRAVPAAGGLYPLLIFLSLSRGDELDCYRYMPEHNRLDCGSSFHGRIRDLCNDQDITDPARALITFVYNVKKNTMKYGPLGLQFALIECGHAAQNLILGAAGIGIGARCIGTVTFEVAHVAFDLKPDQIPLYAVALY